MLVAIDFGITNTDVVINEAEKNKFYTFPTKKINRSEEHTSELQSQD